MEDSWQNRNICLYHFSVATAMLSTNRAHDLERPLSFCYQCFRRRIAKMGICINLGAGRGAVSLIL